MSKRSFFLGGAVVVTGLAGGPVCPLYGANANLFISAERSNSDKSFGGPAVVEVMIQDLDIEETDEAEGEPDVTVNGQILRMAQATNGSWYGYFAVSDAAHAADQTVGLPGTGLDFGVIVDSATAEVAAGVVFSDPFEVALPKAIVPGGGPLLNHVVRNPPALNTDPQVLSGQIGIDPVQWPVVQVIDLPAPGEVVTKLVNGQVVVEVLEDWAPVIVQYNKGGGVQTTTLSYNDLPDVAIGTDKAQYLPGEDVLLAIFDPQLNIDPTDNDSWTFDVSGEGKTFYQAFNADGVGDANGTAGLVDLGPDLDDLFFDGRGVLTMTLTSGLELGSNDHQPDMSVNDNVTSFSSIVTLVETDADSGIFTVFDDSGRSIIRIADDAQPGVVGELMYHGQTIPIVVVPEVSSLSMLVIGGLAAANRRRHR